DVCSSDLDKNRNRVAIGVRDGEIRNAVAVEVTYCESERPHADWNLDGPRKTGAAAVEQNGHTVPGDVRVSQIHPAVSIEVRGGNAARANIRCVVVLCEGQRLRGRGRRE